MKDTYVAVDLETTGLSPLSDRILEIGAVKVEGGQITDTFESFVACEKPIPWRITQLTGITEEMTAGSPDFETVFEAFLAFSGELPLLGHNLPFDFGFLKQSAYRIGKAYAREGIDTLKIARICLPGDQGKALDKLAAFYGIPQVQHHRALEDAKTALLLYENLAGEFEKRYPDVFDPQPLCYQIKKDGPITNSQKAYLRELVKYHRIEQNICIELLTKREASRMIDRIILQYGRILKDGKPEL